MNKKVKSISIFASLSILLILSFIGCAEPTNPVVKHKITYESSFGTQLNEVTLDENTKLEQKHLPSLSDADNKFLGWFNGEDEIKVGHVLKSDLALKARWENLSVDEISFSSESVDKGDSITLSSMDGATIYYTIDGTDPKLKENKYTGPIVINNETTIKAYAVKEGRKDSKVVTKTITIKTYSVTFQDPLNFIQPLTTDGYLKGTPFSAVTKTTDIPKKFDYKFLGWLEEGKTDLAKDDDQITRDVVYKASWRSFYGDIILNDGSTVPYTEITEEQKKNAIAVTCGFKDDGKRIGLGLNISNYTEGSFANQNTIAYNNKIDNIEVYSDGLGGQKEHDEYNRSEVFEVKLSGDKDGSNNWAEIVNVYKQNKQDEAKALEDCPAFKWAHEYGTKFALPDKYKTGWYIPSIIEEIDYILKHYSDINESLKSLNKNEFKDQVFTSSSQHKIQDNNWVISFNPDWLSVSAINKKTKTFALCMRVFDK